MKLLVGKQCGLETLRFLLLSDTPKLNTATHGAAAMEILAKENGLLPCWKFRLWYRRKRRLGPASFQIQKRTGNYRVSKLINNARNDLPDCIKVA